MAKIVKNYWRDKIIEILNTRISDDVFVQKWKNKLEGRQRLRVRACRQTWNSVVLACIPKWVRCANVD